VNGVIGFDGLYEDLEEQR